MTTGSNVSLEHVSSSEETARAMDRISRYLVASGLFAVLLIHPYYRRFRRFSESASSDCVQVATPLLLLSFLVYGESQEIFTFFKLQLFFKLKLIFEEGKPSLSSKPRRWIRIVIAGVFPRSLRSVINSRLQELKERAYPRQLQSFSIQQWIRTSLVWIVLTRALIAPFLMAFSVIVWLPYTVVRAFTTTLWTALRTVPALLALLVVVFITGDAWKLFGVEPDWRLFALILLITGMSIAVTLYALRGREGNWRAAIRYSNGDTKLLASWAEKTPARVLIKMNVQPLLPDRLDSYEFTSPKGYEINISIIYAFIVVTHIIAVAFWVSLMFVIVGVVAVNGTQTYGLSGKDADVIRQIYFLGQDYILTRQLILVSVMLGVIAALTFVAGTLQDTDKRRVVIDDALTSLRHTLGAFAYYYGEVRAMLRKIDQILRSRPGRSAEGEVSEALDNTRNSAESDTRATANEQGSSPDSNLGKSRDSNS